MTQQARGLPIRAYSWAHRRMNELVQECGSVEAAAEKIDMLPEIFAFHIDQPEGSVVPNILEVMVRLARDEAEIDELCAQHFPETHGRWLRVREKIDMNFWDCAAMELVYQNRHFANIDFLARTKGGIAKEDIQMEWGLDGLAKADLLVQLGQLDEDDSTYTKTIDGNNKAKIIVSIAAEHSILEHEKKLEKDKDYEIKEFKEFLKTAEALERRQKMN